MGSSLDMIILSCAGYDRTDLELSPARGLLLARITRAEAFSMSILSASETDFRKHYEKVCFDPILLNKSDDNLRKIELTDRGAIDRWFGCAFMLA
jgi:hypothetical protein